MTRYFTGKVQIQTGQLIGAGGEGQVFAINGKPAKAAKIYNDTLRATREAKVEAMVRAGLAKGDDLISWPEAVLRDDQGRFCGFQMRKVSGHRPLHLLYGPKSRRQQFPKADYRFVVRAAQNIAKAVASVHGSSVVIGDLNHSGILISANATAALIDADSFQFSDGKTLFPCLVGVEDFLRQNCKAGICPKIRARSSRITSLWLSPSFSCSLWGATPMQGSARIRI